MGGITKQSAAMELRRRFPGIMDNAKAREQARVIAGWQRLPNRPAAPNHSVGRIWCLGLAKENQMVVRQTDLASDLFRCGR